MSIKRGTNAAHTAVGGQVFVVTPDNRLHNLKGATASFIWDQLEGGETSVDQLARQISVEFEVDAETARADLDSFIEKAVEAGVLSRG